ncbi:unnamed protein product [Cuscuta campestris]|uniref:Uncharacterized protein n=1 Tax=Cuscuta campestris TaxID=132261 RepID=A0A484KL25_9ASTE|nr:unnamed protein product [Cuscuta campestris]
MLIFYSDYWTTTVTVDYCLLVVDRDNAPEGSHFPQKTISLRSYFKTNLKQCRFFLSSATASRQLFFFFDVLLSAAGQ